MPPDKWFENHLTEGGAALGWAFYAYVGKTLQSLKEGKQSKQEHRTHGVGANESHAECDDAISDADEE